MTDNQYTQFIVLVIKHKLDYGWLAFEEVSIFSSNSSTKY